MIKKALQLVAAVLISTATAYGQCSTPTISSPVTLGYACRNFTFSNVNLNSTSNNVLTNVTAGATITLSFDWNVSQGCSYCDGCIVQGYYGINNYFSNCFTNFGGYGNTGGSESISFTAPSTAGIYYIALGGGLDYGCNNANWRPSCSPNSAFGAIVIGSPITNATVSVAGQDTICPTGSALLTAVTSGSGCSGAFTNYQWQLNGVNISGANSSTYSATQSGDYTVTWSNCAESVTSSAMTMTGNAATATFSFPGVLCNGTTTTLTADTGSGWAYQWMFNGQNINGATAAIFNASSVGDYNLQVINNYGCSAISTTATLHDLPVVIASSNISVCNGSSATLTSDGAVSYDWLPSNTLDNSNSASVVSTPSSTTTYTVTGTDGNGCTNNAMVEVDVNANPLATPVINASGPTSFCFGSSVTLSSSVNAPHFLWSSGDTTSFITTTQTGNYILTISDDNGCFKTTASTDVSVMTLPVATLTQTADCNGNNNVSLSLGPNYAVGSVLDPQDACAWGDYIDGFTFNTLFNFSSGCSNNINNYTLFNNFTTSVLQDSTYNLFLIPDPGQFDALAVGIWIDYNQNGSFDDPGEFVFSTSAYYGDISGSITIPSNASPGITRMRVRVQDWSSFSAGDAANPVDLGETEDYNITIGNTNITYSWTSSPAGFASTNAYPVITSGMDTTYILTVTDSVSGCSRTSSVVVDSNHVFPQAFGDNIWNVYAYDGSNFDTYMGYYTEPNLSFSSTDRWDPNYGSPSDASGYNGCVVDQSPNSVKYKRQGFPCGIYSIDIPGHDDECYVYINDSLVFEDSTCCNSDINIWTGFLDANSKVEFQWQQSGGASYGSLTFNVIANNPADADVITGAAIVCPNVQNIVYSVPQITGATSYIWSLPQGATIVSGDSTNSVSVSFSNNTVSGNISVYGVNECGAGAASSYSVTINPMPSNTVTAGGSTTFCSGGTVTLYASNASSYLWTTGDTTSSITVTSTGNYSVTLFNSSGCSNIGDTAVVIVNTPPTVTLNSFSNVGVCNQSFALTGGSPAGGTYSGTGVTNNSFNPSVGAGTYSITYSYTDGNGCSASDSTNITVDAAPTVTLNSFSNVGNCAQSFTLTGGSPTGGTYSGTGVTNNTFLPSIGAGTYSITYSYTDGNGCSASDSTNITVVAAPTVTLNSFSNVGVCNQSFALTGGSPTGGTYSGTGVTNNTFHPSIGAGTYSITYSYTDGNGCSASDSTDITVIAAPTVTLSSFNNVGICNQSFALTGGSPTGGTYSGNGVTNNTFHPSVGAGTYLITYSYTDGNGCSASDSANITVVAAPTITLNSFSNVGVCNQSVALTGGSPTGGTYSGTGVTNNTFHPSVGAGTYSITYSYTDGNGCSASDSTDITVIAAPTVTLSSFNNVGICNQSFALTGGSPTGGTYSGTGVTNNTFHPSVGAGTYSITYSYTDGNGCSASDSANITVVAAPTVTLSSFNNVGICNQSFALTGGSPTGGTYSGTGVSNNSFHPSIGAGTYSITYSYTDGNGCSASDSANITVVAAPTVTLSSFNNVGICNQSFALTGGSPSGGTYSGTGVTNNTFHPSVGAGTYSITYSYTDGNGCSASDSANITVVAAPTVTLNSFSSVCSNDSPFSLTGGSPTGGTYSGTGITNGNFNPSVGAGTYTVTYTYTDNYGCSNSDTASITVNSLPNVTLSPFNDVCSTSQSFALSGGSPSGGTYSGNGVTGGMFDPSIAGAGTTTITYSYTAGNGCTGTASQPINVSVCTGIEQISTPLIRIYPNPTHSLVSIEIANSAAAQSIAVCDITGKELFRNNIATESKQLASGKQTANKIQLDMSKFAKGIYFIRIQLSNNTIVRKLVVE